MRLDSSASSSCEETSAAWTLTSFSPVHSASAPSAAISAIIVSTSRIRGTLLSTTGSLVSRQAASTGRAPFLFPAARTRPLRRLAALDHEGLGEHVGDGSLGHTRALS